MNLPNPSSNILSASSKTKYVILLVSMWRSLIISITRPCAPMNTIGSDKFHNKHLNEITQAILTGVAMTISQPAFSAFSCSHLFIPPRTATVLSKQQLYHLSDTFASEYTQTYTSTNCPVTLICFNQKWTSHPSN
jgi:hypothetical protein